MNELQDIHHAQMVDNVKSFYYILFHLISSMVHEQVAQSAKIAIDEVYPPEPYFLNYIFTDLSAKIVIRAVPDASIVISSFIAQKLSEHQEVFDLAVSS